MTHFIIESKQGVLHRIDKNLWEVSMKTGKDLRNGLIFSDMNQLEERGFKIIDEVPANAKFRFGY
jgi:hypothetical protein